MAIIDGQQAFPIVGTEAGPIISVLAGEIAPVSFDTGYATGVEDAQRTAAKPEARSVQGRRITFVAKDSDGIPLTSLTPTWTRYVDAETGSTQTVPTITNLGGGNYSFVPTGSHPAGILDVGETAVPRYLVYCALSSVWAFAAFNISSGVPLAGLTPTWFSLKKTDGNNYTPQPSFSSLGGGLYKTTFLSERVSGIINLGSTARPQYIPYSNDRLVLLLPVNES